MDFSPTFPCLVHFSYFFFFVLSFHLIFRTLLSFPKFSLLVLFFYPFLIFSLNFLSYETETFTSFLLLSLSLGFFQFYWFFLFHYFALPFLSYPFTFHFFYLSYSKGQHNAFQSHSQLYIFSYCIIFSPSSDFISFLLFIFHLFSRFSISFHKFMDTYSVSSWSYLEEISFSLLTALCFSSRALSLASRRFLYRKKETSFN